MTYQVYDCLANLEISSHASRSEADQIKEIHGGADNCIHVFEIEEQDEKVEIKEKKPLAGMLF